MFSLGFRKLWWIRPAADYQTGTNDSYFLGASLALGSALELLLSLVTEFGYHWLSFKIHFLSHVTIQLRNGSLLHRIREDDTSRKNFFLFVVNL